MYLTYMTPRRTYVESLRMRVVEITSFRTTTCAVFIFHAKLMQSFPEIRLLRGSCNVDCPCNKAVRNPRRNTSAQIEPHVRAVWQQLLGANARGVLDRTSLAV